MQVVSNDHSLTHIALQFCLCEHHYCVYIQIIRFSTQKSRKLVSKTPKIESFCPKLSSTLSSGRVRRTRYLISAGADAPVAPVLTRPLSIKSTDLFNCTGFLLRVLVLNFMTALTFKRTVSIKSTGMINCTSFLPIILVYYQS